MRYIAIVGVWVALATYATYAIAAGVPGRNTGGYGGGYGDFMPGGYIPGGGGCGCPPTPVMRPPGRYQKTPVERAQHAAELRAVRPQPKPAHRWQTPHVVDFGTRPNATTRSTR